MGKHYVKQCKKCLDVISQCRCASPTKEIRWGVCDVCAGKTEQEESARPIFMATTGAMGLSTSDAMFAWTRFLARVTLKARLKEGQTAAIIIDGPEAKIVPITMMPDSNAGPAIVHGTVKDLKPPKGIWIETEEEKDET